MKRSGSDLVLAFFVVAVAVMLLVPLPTWLLDILLASNLGFALLLLLVGLSSASALSLLSFPAILLLTTLYRLSLSVASTRLILTQGDAGRVIEAFGTLLVRGEVLVGLVLFLIITIVNFIVIARGSSRVSEVAARFALDALPGKQLAIDADLRSGLMTPDEAQARREDLRRESQLYGSMDGAMKFVQGDAIAGLFIIAVNIFAGIYLGVRGGLTFSEAIETYTRLTVGDGLVHQIPAILISICAGIVVTRVSSGEGATLGKDLGAQIFTRPGVLLFSGAVVAFFGVLPGLPTMPFLLVGVSLAGAGAFAWRRASPLVRLSVSLPGGADGRVPLLGRVDHDGRLVVQVEAGLYSRLVRDDGSRIQAFWQRLGDDFVEACGFRTPLLNLVADDGLGMNNYRVLVSGAEVLAGQLIPDTICVQLSPDNARALGLDLVSETRLPHSGGRIFWAPQDRATRAVLEAAEMPYFEPLEYVCIQAVDFLRRHPEEVFGLTDVHQQLKSLEKKHPGLMSEVFREAFVNVSQLTEVLQELVRQGFSIRDFRSIVEQVAAFCGERGISLSDSSEFDPEDLIAYLRLHRRRAFVGALLTQRKTLKVVLLKEETSSQISDGVILGQSPSLALDPDALGALERQLGEILGPIRTRGLGPVSLLCATEVRPQVVKLLSVIEPLLRVVTFDQLEASTPVESIGAW